MVIRIFEEKKNELYVGRVLSKYSAKVKAEAETGDNK
jgi:hypothetical protein